MQDYLEHDLNVPRNQIRNLRDSQATRAAIIEALMELRQDPRINRGDPILIFFAGHGGSQKGPVEWECGGTGAMIQLLIPADENTQSGGNTPGIPDYTIGVLLQRIHEEKGNNIVRLFSYYRSSN